MQILSNKVDKHMLTGISHYTTAIKQSPSGRDYQWPPTIILSLLVCICKVWFGSCRGTNGSAGSEETGLCAHNCKICKIPKNSLKLLYYPVAWPRIKITFWPWQSRLDSFEQKKSWVGSFEWLSIIPPLQLQKVFSVLDSAGPSVRI